MKIGPDKQGELSWLHGYSRPTAPQEMKWRGRLGIEFTCWQSCRSDPVRIG